VFCLPNNVRELPQSRMVGRIRGDQGSAVPKKRGFMSLRSTSVAGPPAKHHYIPKFYQRGFINDKSNQIWVYEKGRQPRRLAIRKAGMKIAFYGFTKRHGELDIETVERELSRVDDYGAKVIQRIEKRHPLDDKQRRRLCRFVSVMWRRTPKHMEQANKMAKEMMPGFLAVHDDEWLRRTIGERYGSSVEAQGMLEKWQGELQDIRDRYSRNVPDFLFPSNTLRDSMFERVMYFMDWAFFQASPNTEFLTCDDPVLFSKGSGLKDREAVIMFPLSRNLFFQAMWISEWANSYQPLDETQIRQLNEYVVRNAHQQVYSSKKSNEITGLVNEQIGTF
jgi:Protein of unknown function (DUF4238)